jgi:hypothetical protein
MSKSNPFSSFADAADITTNPDVTFTTKNTQLTVEELIKALQAIVRRDPSMKDARVYRVEYGSMTPSTQVETQAENVIIA